MNYFYFVSLSFLVLFINSLVICSNSHVAHTLDFFYTRHCIQNPILVPRKDGVLRVATHLVSRVIWSQPLSSFWHTTQSRLSLSRSQPTLITVWFNLNFGLLD